MLMQLPALKDVRKHAARRLRHPRGGRRARRLHRAFDTRDTERALEGTGIAVPELDDLRRASCGTTGSATSTRTSSRTARSRAAVNGKTVVITGASSAASAARRRSRSPPPAASRCSSRAARRSWTRSRRRSRPPAAPRSSTPPTSPTWRRSTTLVERMLADHAAIDMLVNNAGRSIRRSIALSHDRFHDFERTMQLNYFGAIRLVMGLLPHMQRAQVRPRRQRQLDRRADEPAALQRLRRLEGRARRLDARRQLAS